VDVSNIKLKFTRVLDDNKPIILNFMIAVAIDNFSVVSRCARFITKMAVNLRT